jgi:hypothetical protein
MVIWRKNLKLRLFDIPAPPHLFLTLILKSIIFTLNCDKSRSLQASCYDGYGVRAFLK